ncbi:MAG: type II toxin-antitoxin system RelE/ParE family toxin [Pedobacter sp.]|nr:type II toxin-antitoxin system RelE/ParE family toxin [Chitinophagaceae bacterium]
MGNYILTNKAIEDLSEIWYYTVDTWSERQADKYYTMLLDACKELAEEKLSGKKYPEIRADVLGFRIGQHIIFFRKANNNTIEIARILHSSMDLKNRIDE